MWGRKGGTACPLPGEQKAKGVFGITFDPSSPLHLPALPWVQQAACLASHTFRTSMRSLCFGLKG